MNPPSNWPQGCKREKEYQKAKKQTESNNINVQVHTIVDMAIATLERTTIIQDQSIMAIFSMFNDQLQSHEAREYFCP
jgi:DNA repair exonuclease SbcCD ATPase subunit